jgi:hypothetical protein
MIRGIAAEEPFAYEIMRLCPGHTLTRLDKLRKMKGIQGTKEKTTSAFSSFGRHREAANRLIPIELKRSSLQCHSQVTACMVAGGFVWLPQFFRERQTFRPPTNGFPH